VGEITPATRKAPASAGGHSKYRATQQKLKGFEQDLDQLKMLLEQLAQRINDNADRALSTGRRAHDSDFDPRPVSLANAVGIALGGMGTDAAVLIQMASELAAKAADAQRTHQRRYEPLDKVRSQRRVRTPKPGAFVQRP